MRILLIDDSPRVAQTASTALRSRGYAVSIAGSVEGAEELFASLAIDLVIVDVMLPDGSGLDWCRAAREAGSTVPILILTARTAVPDRIRGLDCGADDYLVKPFAVDELVARVRALGRRGPRWTDSTRSYGELVIDRDRRLVSVRGERLAFTPREFDIVALLASRDGRVVSRDELLDSVWGTSTERSGASFDVLLARVRRKLGERGIEGAVRTVRQVGYAWTLAISKHA
ncbi:MAG TPA: response regulator transcription factor [Polyangiaceae bacterium]